MTTLTPRFTKGAAVATAAVLLGSLAACSSPAAPDTSTVTIAYNSDLAPQGYDPLRYSAAQGLLFSGLYDSLAELQPDGSAGPGLATDFAYNDDNTVLTMTLLDGIEFPDGSTLTADLVKANLDRRSDPELVAYGSFAAGGAAEISSVDVVDDTHVAVTFVEGQPGFESNLTAVAGSIVGQDGIDDPSSLATTPDGSGPFGLADNTVKGSSYVLEKKSDHRNLDDYAFDTMIIKPIDDAQARVNAVISGQADTGFIDTSTAQVAEDKGKSLSQIGGTVMSALVFDKSGATTPAFADPNVRVALGLAIDRDELVEGVHPGNTPAVNALPADNPGFSDDIDSEYAYDPERAKQMLADAGYPDGFEFEVVSAPADQRDYEALQTYFAAVGVTMNISLATSTDELFGAVNTKPIGLLAVNWGNPVGTMFGVVLGFANPRGDVNEALVGATQAVAGAQSDDDRAAALTDLNSVLVTTGWIIPIYEQVTTWAYDASKLAPITFPGGNDTPLLSSFKPAK